MERTSRKKLLSAGHRASSSRADASSRGLAAGRLKSNDSLESLWQLAAWSRRQFAAPLVAVTGSVGKTTTRRMIDAVLGIAFVRHDESEELQ